MSIFQNDPDVSFIAGRVDIIDVNGISVKDGFQSEWYEKALSRFNQTRNLFESLLEENFLVTTSNYFFRRELWLTLGGFNELRYCHDLDFVLRALKSHKAYLDLENFHVKYRIHDNNTIAENIEKIRLERCIVLTYNALDYRSSQVNPIKKYLFDLRFRSIMQKHGFITAHEFLQVIYKTGDTFSEFHQRCVLRISKKNPALNLNF